MHQLFVSSDGRNLFLSVSAAVDLHVNEHDTEAFILSGTQFQAGSELHFHYNSMKVCLTDAESSSQQLFHFFQMLQNKSMLLRSYFKKKKKKKKKTTGKKRQS